MPPSSVRFEVMMKEKGNEDKEAKERERTRKLEKFLDHLEWASKVVSKWPAWKRDVLGKID